MTSRPGELHADSAAPAGVMLAHRTLTRGAAFLALEPRDGQANVGADLLASTAGARYVANCLRELDRFLNLLVDEIAAHTAPPGHDVVAFRRLHNTANKLARTRQMLGMGSDDKALFRALGRARAALFHLGRNDRTGDIRAVLTMVGNLPARDSAQAAGTGVERLTSATLARIAWLYSCVADELVAQTPVELRLH